MSSAVGVAVGRAAQPCAKPTNTRANRPAQAEKHLMRRVHGSAGEVHDERHDQLGPDGVDEPPDRIDAAADGLLTIRVSAKGSTVLARMPCSAPSMAITLASPRRPAFAAA